MTIVRHCLVVVVAGLWAGGHAAAQGAPDTTPIWHVKGTGSGTPVYEGDTAYFLSDDRKVSAVDVGTGDVRWTTATGVPGYDAFFGTGTAGTALALAGSTVVAGDWDVVGFDRATGTRRWIYEAPAGDGPGLFLGPHRDGVVYTGSPGGRAYALDAATGRLRWMTTIVEGGMTSVFRPVIDGGRVFVGYSTYVNPNVEAWPCSRPTPAVSDGARRSRSPANAGSTRTWRADPCWSMTSSSGRPVTATSTHSTPRTAPCDGRFRGGAGRWAV